MNKVYDGIMGFIVGDALGVPYEFMKRDTFKCTNMVGYGTHNQPPGTWSDDSSMVLATLYSINKRGYIDYDDIMKQFSNWFFNEKFTANGKVFDFGNTTRKALNRYKSGIPYYECGCNENFDNGNGGLMRILPLAFFDEYLIEEIETVCALTHNTEKSKFACLTYVEIARNIIKENDLNDLFFNSVKKIKRKDIKSDGYVINSLYAALWCFLTTSSYKKCVLKAVNLGNDTDTIAALAGGLAGLKYGVENIPKEWIYKIAKKDWIKHQCENFKKSI